jgi:hypothetical protein
MPKEIVGGISDLVRAVDKRVYPGNNPGDLIRHELAHGRAHETYGGTGLYGIYYVTYSQEIPTIINETYTIWEQIFVEVVAGAFYLPDEPMESIPPKVRMEMAEAPGKLEMSGSPQEGWGDWGVWWQAYQELLQQEWLDSITETETVNQFEEDNVSLSWPEMEYDSQENFDHPLEVKSDPYEEPGLDLESFGVFVLTIAHSITALEPEQATEILERISILESEYDISLSQLDSSPNQETQEEDSLNATIINIFLMAAMNTLKTKNQPLEST